MRSIKCHTCGKRFTDLNKLRKHTELCAGSIDAPTRRTLRVCYVCNHKISGEPVRIGASAKYPDGLWRHLRCVPGGARWLDSEVGKHSELRNFYEGGDV